MTNRAPSDPSARQSAASAAPAITATADHVITGAGFLPDHKVTVCVRYIAEGMSDYLNYTTDPGGYLYAELPTSPTTGVLHITATDHRADLDGPCGLRWSNTETLRACNP
jgi:hypothetical protein